MTVHRIVARRRETVPIYLLEIAGRSLVVYLAVVALLRLGGRRELSQATTTDIVVMILIANGVQNAMVGPDTSVEGGLVSAATLVLANFVVSRLRTQFPQIQRILDGRTVTIAADGEWVPQALRSLGLTPEDALDEMGSEVTDVGDLAWATVDPSGHIRYKTRAGTVHRTSQRVADG